MFLTKGKAGYLAVEVVNPSFVMEGLQHGSTHPYADNFKLFLINIDDIPGHEVGVEVEL